MQCDEELDEEDELDEEGGPGETRQQSNFISPQKFDVREEYCAAEIETESFRKYIKEQMSGADLTRNNQASKSKSMP